MTSLYHDFYKTIFSLLTHNGKSVEIKMQD